MPKEGRSKQVLHRKAGRSEEMRLGGNEWALQTPGMAGGKEAALEEESQHRYMLTRAQGSFPRACGWSWALKGENR